MKTFALAALAAAASATTWEDDVAIVAGVIYGITEADHLTELQGCLKENAIFAKDLGTAIEEFMHVDGDMRNLIVAFRLIGNVLHHMPEDIQYCKNVGADWGTFVAWCDEFLKPIGLIETIAYNAIHNPIKVAEGVMKAKKDWNSGNYFTFGEDLSKDLFFLTLPHTSQ